MTTIEERAEKFADENYRNLQRYSGLKIAFIQGATEQRKIDINKACETYCKVCFNKTTDCKNFCNDVNIFRLAMES